MVSVIVAACFLAQSNLTSLEAGFRNPPASAKPYTWWHWMSGNVTKEGITADLEAMKAAGIGGAHIFDAGQGIPAGPVQYNSPEWRSLMSFAFHEAKRLGLDMTMHNCSGWSSSGGPWVTPEDAMKKITSSATAATGGKPVVLAQPKVTGDYYKDLQVVAFPSKTALGTDHLNTLSGLGPNPGKVDSLDWPTVAKSSMISIPLDRVGKDGKLDFELPEGEWTVLRIGVTLTGAHNVASRPSGEGLEVDKLSKASLDKFFAGGLDPLFKEVGSDSALHTVLIDSYETGYNNWTPEILKEFKARRGYDATPFLPALAGVQIDNGEETLGFLFDYRRTLAELWAENYSGYFAKKLAQKGLGLAVEPYGNGNFDPFTYGEPASLIMGEFWVGESPINPSVKVASSVAHIYGHSVVGAESLTASPNQAGWRNQPRRWKPFADVGMTSGINRIIYHRMAHQPWVSGVNPGMTMGPWGSNVDRTNTIWPYMLPWNTYLARSQFMLQSGKPANDILVFEGEDVPQSYSGEGQDIPVMAKGNEFDYIGLGALKSVKVKNHRVTLPDGVSYAVLVLPNTDKMTVGLATKIKELVGAGARVLSPKPTTTPSLGESSHDGNAKVRAVGAAVWGSGSQASGSRSFGAGTIYWGKTVEEVLDDLHVGPDFLTGIQDIHAIHRKYGTTDAFFVASSLPYPVGAICGFRAPSGNVSVQLWHPETGKIENAPEWSYQMGNIMVPLSFDSTESVFVVIKPVAAVAPHMTGSSVGLDSALTKKVPVLRILKASYGDPQSGKVSDVTKLLENAIAEGSLRVVASNAAMGGDPAYLVLKSLTVTYELDGETKTVTIPENGTLSIGDLPDEGTPPLYRIESGKLVAWTNGAFTQNWSDGSKTKIEVHDIPAGAPVTGPWQITFRSTYDPPKSTTYVSLKSWTEDEDFDIKYFSGTGTYVKTLTVSKERLQSGQRLYLDLGDVRELCRVRLNGKEVATMWKPPFRVDISDFVHSGENSLEIDVTNLWVNRLIGDEQFPDDMGWNGSQLSGWPEWFTKHEPRPEPRRKTFTTWRHNFKDTPLLPSGLIGPVMLRSVRVIPLR